MLMVIVGGCIGILLGYVGAHAVHIWWLERKYNVKITNVHFEDHGECFVDVTWSTCSLGADVPVRVVYRLRSHDDDVTQYAGYLHVSHADLNEVDANLVPIPTFVRNTIVKHVHDTCVHVRRQAQERRRKELRQATLDRIQKSDTITV